MTVAVVIPTILGREDHLERCLDAYAERTPSHIDLNVIVEAGHDGCGKAWLAGADKAGDFDYLHLTADDLEPHDGWAEPAIETVERDMIPAPLIFDVAGGLQSAGLKGWDVYTGPHEDWQPIDSTTVPFLTREMWARIGMVPIHYCTDLWVSHKAREHGWGTVIRTDYAFTHHNAQEGRGDQHARTNCDRHTYLDLIA